MEGPLKEKDWKYMRSIRDEMLHKLCADINKRALEIAKAGTGNPHEKYLELYRYIPEADAIFAECFNDWRRSRLTGMQLRHHGLLTNEHAKNLTAGAQEWLLMVEEMENL